MKKYCNNKFKIVFIFVLFTLFFGENAYSQQHWRKIARPTNQNLWKCTFVDTLNGWAVGDSGTIIHTSNGGYTWNVQDSKLREYMRSVFFLNKRLGWAIAWKLSGEFYGTCFLKTTNGGAVWDTTSYPVYDRFFNSYYFTDSLNGFLGGGGVYLHSIFRTTNGGTNWNPCLIDTSSTHFQYPVSKFRFLNSRIGFAVGGILDIGGVIWKTTDYGQTWSASLVANEPVTDIVLFDSLNYLAVGGDYEYGTFTLKTSNGGLNWSYNLLGNFFCPHTISFRTETEAWGSLDYLSKFILTTNAGNTWFDRNTPDSLNVFDLVFKSNRFGIGVCGGGYIIKYFSRPTFSVSGNVKYNDNNQPVTSGMVKAFQLDKSTGNVVYLDSAQIQSDGSYTLLHVPQDTVDIGVFPNSTPPCDWVITYYPSATNWQHAVAIYPSENLNDINITAVRLFSSSANNSANGKVVKITNSMTGNLKDVFVYAKSGNTFVRCDVTDENGVYNLQSLPSGNLKIVVDRLGYAGDSTIVNLTSESNLDSVNFYLQNVYIGIKQISSSIPSEYKLFQNYPNPFNPTTLIRFKINPTGRTRFVTLKVYDILGKEIVTLVNEKLNAGEYEIPFSINQFSNNQLPSGIYFYRLTTDDYSDVKKMILLK